MEAYKQEKFEVMQRARAYGITMMVGTQDECDIAFFDFKKKLDSFEDMTFEAGAASRDAEVVSLTNQRDYEYVRAENVEHDSLLVKIEIAAKDAAIAGLVAALEKISAIEDQMYGADWEEIEEAREIADEALAKVRKP